MSRGLGYVVLLNGAAALTLMAIVALNPESTSRRLAWAMLVFASGAMAGLLSSLFAYVRRLFAVSLPTNIFMRDFLRVSAIVMAVGGRGFPDRDEHGVTNGARGLDYAHKKQAGVSGSIFKAGESAFPSNPRSSAARRVKHCERGKPLARIASNTDRSASGSDSGRKRVNRPWPNTRKLRFAIDPLLVPQSAAAAPAFTAKKPKVHERCGH